MPTVPTHTEPGFSDTEAPSSELREELDESELELISGGPPVVGPTERPY